MEDFLNATLKNLLNAALKNDRAHLPLRPVARVLILKNNHVLLGEVRKTGKLCCYNFPGGGVEPGDSMEETISKETLEEVGVRVTNILPLNISLAAEHPMGKKREHLYRGTDNHYFVADFVGYDTSKLNSEGDAMRFTWETPADALMKIRSTPDPFNGVRERAIYALVPHLV
jgi:8-oxo-dGTP pyrophosphatase MutT (NUDIX family)